MSRANLVGGWCVMVKPAPFSSTTEMLGEFGSTQSC